MSDDNGVNDDAIEIDPPDQTAAADAPVTSPDQAGGGGESVDQQTSAEVASSPTAQGGGPTPDQVAQAPQGVATSQSASFKGVPGGPTAVKDIFAQHEAAAAQDNALDSANTDARLAKYAQDNAAVGKAYQGEVDASKVYGDEDKRLHGLIAQEAQRQAGAEAKAQQDWSVERAEKLRDYQQQLTAVQALALQSGSPFVGMGKGAYLGLAGAEFAQGFLAARGVKIDVSGQIDKWVDQSIQEHQFQVNTMQNVANAKLHLYDVARQSSMDDTEARARYGGMVVAGLQAQVQANANMYQSNLAQAQAQVAQAQLKTKGDEYSDTIVQQYQARAEGRLRAEQQAAYRQSEMSIAEFRAQQAAKVAAARANAVAPPSQLTYFTDPTDTNKQGGKRVYFAVDPKAVGEDAMKEMNKASAVYGSQVNQVKKLRSLFDSADVNGNAPTWWKDTSNPQYQLFKQKATELITGYEQAKGGTREVASASAAKRFDQMIAQHDWTHWGNRAGAVDSLMGDATNDYETLMGDAYHAQKVKGASPGALRAHGIPVDDQGYTASTSDFGAPEKALATAAETNAPPPPPTRTQHAVSTLTSRQATDSAVALTEDGARLAHDRALAGEEPDVEASPNFSAYLKSIGKEPNAWVAENGYRNEYKAIDTLVMSAKAGDEDAKRVLQGMTGGSGLTAGHIPGTNESASKEQIDYARFALARADKSDDTAFLPERLKLNKEQQQAANLRIVNMGRRALKSTYDPRDDGAPADE